MKQAEPRRNMKAMYVTDRKILSENRIEQHILCTFTYCYTLPMYLNDTGQICNQSVFLIVRRN